MENEARKTAGSVPKPGALRRTYSYCNYFYNDCGADHSTSPNSSPATFVGGEGKSKMARREQSAASHFDSAAVAPRIEKRWRL
jgi:hypothetical protein